MASIQLSGRVKPGRPLYLGIFSGNSTPSQIKLLESLHEVLRPLVTWESLSWDEKHEFNFGYKFSVNFFFLDGPEVIDKTLIAPTFTDIIEMYKEELRASRT